MEKFFMIYKIIIMIIFVIFTCLYIFDKMFRKRMDPEQEITNFDYYFGPYWRFNGMLETGMGLLFVQLTELILVHR